MNVHRQKIKGKEYEFSYSKDCFIPTATSNFIIDACIKKFKRVDKLLDLGCGIGIVGLTLSRFINVKDLYSSDISLNAIKYCNINTENHKIKNDIRQGTLFEPWQNEKFDLIVNDISGISEEVACFSSWFEHVPCDSGRDGLKLTKKIIQQSKKFLNDQGNLVFPVISLADHKGLLKFAKSKFRSLTRLSTNSWFLPNEMSLKFDKKLQKIKREGNIYFEEKFGKKICFTDIYLGNF